MHDFWWSSMKWCPLRVKNGAVPFWTMLLVPASQENPASSTSKMKSDIFLKKVEIFVQEHCLPSHYARMRQIWANLNKLCYERDQNIARLSWNLWMFVRDSKFLRTLFQRNFRIATLYFFLVTRSLIMTLRGGFPFFWFFFNFLRWFQNLVKLVAVTVCC